MLPRHYNFETLTTNLPSFNVDVVRYTPERSNETLVAELVLNLSAETPPDIRILELLMIIELNSKGVVTLGPDVAVTEAVVAPGGPPAVTLALTNQLTE
jgi:hypothetical protein